jgi:hypothetical protein
MDCPQCGKPLGGAVAFCPSCGLPIGSTPQPGAERKPDLVEKLVPFKNAPSLVGYYLGIFSLIPCFGLLLGPAAVVFGVLGLRQSRRLPGNVGKAHAWVALICGGIASIVNIGAFALMLAGVLMSAR